MKPSSESLDHAVLKQAAHWYARLQAEKDPHLHADWQRWHDQHDSHQRAWQYVERISARFSPLQGERDTARATLAGARQVRQSRRNVLLGLALFGGAALLARLGWRPLEQNLLAWRADQRTAVGEVRALRLDDGTRLWLNSDSALNIAYTAQQRVLQLVRGEVLIDTAKDARPFFVDTAEGRLQALGTRFSVQQETTDTRLSVFDGAVAIHMGNSASIAAVVNAGHERRFNREQLGTEQPVNAGRQSWSRGILQADNQPLADVIAELRRYHHGHIGVAPEVAGLKVVGTFPQDDLPQTLSMLSSALPIRVEQTLPWWISLEARH
ncbi:FecR domain-containing protein [Pseudomonas sp. 21LCFQ010]|uniref:FecR domain-containing protein n=1 Tax=Pseudomonas sp. 21LCFQ010 TaxID=2957506 RepID=UPI002097E9B3|nr:FecR domain-containing protein [Pseudomonas sp. 21LCFQ010]MCO8163531.1 FecR domain-containing protein [Pseudomonas sp. 21LCFQ010]